MKCAPTGKPGRGASCLGRLLCPYFLGVIFVIFPFLYVNQVNEDEGDAQPQEDKEHKPYGRFFSIENFPSRPQEAEEQNKANAKIYP